jgi:DNA polymerase I-like protein with 3'-5' exonuclease and polymerase domains
VSSCAYLGWLKAPIQGTACDAFKLAACHLHERQSEVGGFEIVALIHDEVVVAVDEDRAEEVLDWTRRVMEAAAASVINARLPKKLTVPIATDGSIGQNLQEAKDASE